MGGFQCRLSAGEWEECTASASYSDLEEGRHIFLVRAVDLAGNPGATPAVHEWTIDTTPPETTITARPPLVATSSAAIFAFRANEPESTFLCSLDEGTPEPCESPKRYTILNETVHLFTVWAVDPADNVEETPERVLWTLDGTPPLIFLGDTPLGVGSSTRATFTFTSNESASTFLCQLDAGPAEGCASPRTYSGLDERQHTFSVVAIDVAGHIGITPQEYTWVVDVTPPERRLPSLRLWWQRLPRRASPSRPLRRGVSSSVGLTISPRRPAPVPRDTVRCRRTRITSWLRRRTRWATPPHRQQDIRGGWTSRRRRR